jgi:hypothetical protein
MRVVIEADESAGTDTESAEHALAKARVLHELSADESESERAELRIDDDGFSL